MESEYTVRQGGPVGDHNFEGLTIAVPKDAPPSSKDRNYLNLPDTPGYAQTIGDRTSLPGSPRYDHSPVSPQIPSISDHQELLQTSDQYTEQQQSALVRLAQAKVVLLGSVAAGKTSLLNSLRYGESRLVPDGPDGRTIGIEVHSVALNPETKLWFYDFGGHDTYHFSQQLFLSQRVIYLLAVDVSIYDPVAFEKTLQHWYTILTSRLVTPVICLLATHIDLCHDREELVRCCQEMHDKLMKMEATHRRTLENELQLLKKEIMSDPSEDIDSIRKFQPKTLHQPMQRLNLLLTNRPRIFHSVCCISSKTLEGMDCLRENLISIVTDNESLFPQKLVPGSWIELSDAILSKKEDVPFITMTEFIEMANSFHIVGDHVQKVLSYLQSVGLVLHYQDYRQNSDLSKYVFVNPNLLLAIFGLVFNHNYFMDETRFVWKHQSILRLPHFDFVHLRKNLKERGIIGETLLKCFWDAIGISDEVYQAIVPLLEKFDLCYEIRIKPGDAMVEGRHFLFPYLLNKKKPPEVNFLWSDELLENFLQCGVELSFSQPKLPFGFLEKVLIRAHTYVDHCLSWKQGLVAFCDEGQDLVRIESRTDSNGNAVLTLSARVRLDRKSMARHILLLLVAVTNRVLLHHYPGIVAYWYCQCAHCLIRNLHEKYTEVKIDRFPADNIVYSSPGDTTPVQCINCTPGQALRLEDVFPRDQEDIHNLKRLMSEASCRALKASSATLIKHMSYRDVMNALLRKQLLNIKQAETIGSKPDHEERAKQLLIYMTHSDQKAFDVLCDELKQSDETAWLAEELRVRAAGRSANLTKDSDSIGSSFLRSSKQGWRGSQGSQASGATSVSNWSTYSRSSYASTGSYIRRPYGSFITREPVHNYKRSVSAASTPQQYRREPLPEKKSEVKAQPSQQEYQMSKSKKTYVPKDDFRNKETKVVDSSYKRLRNIHEFPQQPVTYNVEVTDTHNEIVQTVPPPACEVEVSTTTFVVSSAQQNFTEAHDNNSVERDLSDDALQTNIDSDIIPNVTTETEVKHRTKPHNIEKITEAPSNNSVERDFRDGALQTNIDSEIIPKITAETEVKRNRKPQNLQQISEASHNSSIERDLRYDALQTNIDSDIIPKVTIGTEVSQITNSHLEKIADASSNSSGRADLRDGALQTNIESYIIPKVIGETEATQSTMPQNLQKDKEIDIESNIIPETRDFIGKDAAETNDTTNDQVTDNPDNFHYETDIDAQSSPYGSEKERENQATIFDPSSDNQTKYENLGQYSSSKNEFKTFFPDFESSESKPTEQPKQYPQRNSPLSQTTLYPETEEKLDEMQREEAEYASQTQPKELHHPDMPPHLHKHPNKPVVKDQKQKPEHSLEPERLSPETCGERLDPSSIVYKETDIDAAPQQAQMPRDVRVRSTDDILGQVQKNEPRQSGNDEARRYHESSASTSHLVQPRGRPRMKNSIGLIGSADLGPKHVLQDMDPIKLPVRPIKRSRSNSLNKSLRRSKSKSPQKTPEDRHTWAVPYDWEQHKSMESLSNGDAHTRRKSGGFVFAVSAIDVRQSNEPKQRKNSPPVFTSQPTLNTEDGRYSLPRPTGKKSAELPQHQYVEPLPIPDSFDVSQSAPVQRKQMGIVNQPPLPSYGAPSSQDNRHPFQGSHMQRPMNNQQKGSLAPSDVFYDGFSTQMPNPHVLGHRQENKQVMQQQSASRPPGPKPFSSKLSDCSDATGSYHTGRSRTGSEDSDNATITSNISELTFESFHTTRSHNPSIASRAISQGSHFSERTMDSYHTGRSYTNSEIPDDVTITSDISELTIDSFHTFNSGMTPTTRGLTSPNNADLTMVSQISDTTVNSFQSCKLSDDEVTLTSKCSGSPEPPFAGDSTPNKLPVRNSKVAERQCPPACAASSQRPPSQTSRPLPPPPARPVNPQEVCVQSLPISEERAPPVPPRRDLMNQASCRPPVSAPPPPPPQQKPPTRNVTFADDYNNDHLKVGAPVARVREAKTVPLPRTDPHWAPSVHGQTHAVPVPQVAATTDKKKKKKKSDKKSKKSLLPYVGTTPEHDKAVRTMTGPDHSRNQERPRDRTLDGVLLNNNAPVSKVRKEIVQNYIDSIPPGTRMPQPHLQEDQRQMSMRINPRTGTNMHGITPSDHSKPHAYVQPYVRGPNGTGPWLDNVNSNNGNQTSNGQGLPKSASMQYPYDGGNGNGIVLVEEPYVPRREMNGNNNQHAPPNVQLRYSPEGSISSTGSASRRIPPSLTHPERVQGDRSSVASNESGYYVTGPRDTAV